MVWVEGSGQMLEMIECFRDLPPPVLQRLEQGGYAVTPKDGAEIFAQDDPANAVYAVIGGDGRVRIASAGGHSKVLMAQSFGVGEIFGEIAVLDGGTRSAEAVATGRVQLWRIGATPFLDVLQSTPALGVGLARMMAKRLRRTHLLLQDATFASLEARLARQLLYLAALDGKRTDQGVRVPGRFRQGDLADLLGVTTRSIINVLNDWRADGIVVYDTNRALLTICREDALRGLVGES